MPQGGPKILHPHANIEDVEAISTRHYGGARLQLHRQGGANANDLFGASGEVTLADDLVSLEGVIIGSYSRASGNLSIAFNEQATGDAVNATMQALTYQNTGTIHENVAIDWVFTDQNGEGALTSSATQHLSVLDLVPRANERNVLLEPGTALISSLSLNGNHYFQWDRSPDLDIDLHDEGNKMTHDALDELFNLNQDTTNTQRSTTLRISTTEAVEVKLPTLDELMDIYNIHNDYKSEEWETGVHWSATRGDQDKHYALDFATGQVMLFEDSNLQHVVLQVL